MSSHVGSLVAVEKIRRRRFHPVIGSAVAAAKGKLDILDTLGDGLETDEPSNW
jgi:hypothetical protein